MSDIVTIRPDSDDPKEAAASSETLLNTRQAAELMHVSPVWLDHSRSPRSKHPGPRFIKIGFMVRYEKSAIMEWLRSNELDPAVMKAAKAE